jgi:hypothetical protein
MTSTVAYVNHKIKKISFSQDYDIQSISSRSVEKLDIFSCPQLRTINCPNVMFLKISGVPLSVIRFRFLINLTCDYMDNLTTIECPILLSLSVYECPNLRIMNCPQMDTLLVEHPTGFTAIRNKSLVHLNMYNVPDVQTIVCPNLKRLDLNNCPGLVVVDAPKLFELSIMDCYQLKYINAMNIKHLNIDDCPIFIRNGVTDITSYESYIRKIRTIKLLLKKTGPGSRYPVDKSVIKQLKNFL